MNVWYLTMCKFQWHIWGLSLQDIAIINEQNFSFILQKGNTPLS
jgi:hypothetical protein